MTNGHRMPFADWLGRMAECGLAPAARVIAIYAAVFDITKNSELARVCGVSSPRTLDKWKALLVANGWVLIPPCRGGRENGIEIIPAYRGTPVSFTDIKPRKGGKYYPRNYCETPANIAEVYEEKPPQILPETPATFAQTPANFAGVPSRVVDNNKLSNQLIDNNNINNNIIYNNNINNNIIYNNNITSAARERGLTVDELNHLEAEMVTACNGALDNTVNCLGLTNLAEPIMWLKEGCDLDADIIPTLRGYGRAKRGDRINSWRYFTKAVTKARDARLAGLPAPSAAPTKPTSRHKHVPRGENEGFEDVNLRKALQIEKGEI